uniref:Beta-2-microglobulin n=1 Tax=Lateolabrax maculatus TaxID=315492 RepID=A0A385IUN4_LATMC|nr:beta-2-microglobulin [Lateolabrax maculatus]QNH85210.1 beta-2-microglobulin [Lateolabrax maculatus]
MRGFVCAVVAGLLCLLALSIAKELAPKVQVYSYGPGVFDKPNTFICHASGFYPPEITIELLRNGELIPEANQTDLAFEEDWHYHLTRHVTFTPVKGDDYACRVTHGGTSKMYTWEPDM